MRRTRSLISVIKDLHGVAAVELALVSSVLIVLVTGLLDFGMVAYNSTSLESAARAAVQYAAKNPTDAAGIKQVVQQSTAVDPATVVVTNSVTCQCPNGTSVSCSGSCGAGILMLIYVSVNVTEPYSLLLPYPGVTSPMQLSGQATMRTQ